MNDNFIIRPATHADIPALEVLIADSARLLSGQDYTVEQIESAIAHIFGVDTELVDDGSYFAVVSPEGEYLACGGWSKRKTLFGGDRFAGRKSGLLDPATEPAKIRAFFVHPAHARKGIGKALLAHCEEAAQAHGFHTVELMATLPGIKLYATHGYEGGDVQFFRQPDGVDVPFLQMRKTFHAQGVNHAATI